jgi:phenylpyruvate tautomerase PptA (4-oxalocrotonate tautomerase family)
LFEGKSDMKRKKKVIAGISRAIIDKGAREGHIHVKLSALSRLSGSISKTKKRGQ